MRATHTTSLGDGGSPRSASGRTGGSPAMWSRGGSVVLHIHDDDDADTDDTPWWGAAPGSPARLSHGSPASSQPSAPAWQRPPSPRHGDEAHAYSPLLDDAGCADSGCARVGHTHVRSHTADIASETSCLLQICAEDDVHASAAAAAVDAAAAAAARAYPRCTACTGGSGRHLRASTVDVADLCGQGGKRRRGGTRESAARRGSSRMGVSLGVLGTDRCADAVDGLRGEGAAALHKALPHPPAARSNAAVLPTTTPTRIGGAWADAAAAADGIVDPLVRPTHTAGGGGGCDADCALCLDLLSAEAPADVLPCRHRFHAECVYALFRQSARRVCPMCRGHIAGLYLPRGDEMVPRSLLDETYVRYGVGARFCEAPLELCGGGSRGVERVHSVFRRNGHVVWQLYPWCYGPPTSSADYARRVVIPCVVLELVDSRGRRHTDHNPAAVTLSLVNVPGAVTHCERVEFVDGTAVLRDIVVEYTRPAALHRAVTIRFTFAAPGYDVDGAVLVAGFRTQDDIRTPLVFLAFLVVLAAVATPLAVVMSLSGAR